MLPRDVLEIVAFDHIKSLGDLNVFARTCSLWNASSQRAFNSQRVRILHRCHYLLKLEIERLQARCNENRAFLNKVGSMLYGLRNINTNTPPLQKDIEFYQQIKHELNRISTFDNIFNLILRLANHADVKYINALQIQALTHRNATKTEFNYALIVQLREILIVDFPKEYRQKINALSAEMNDPAYIRREGLCDELYLLGAFDVIEENTVTGIVILNKRANEIRALIKANAPDEEGKHLVCNFIPEEYQSWFHILFISKQHQSTLNFFDEKSYSADRQNCRLG